MLDIIRHNPYRLIGVFSTATRKEIVANLARIKANMRVNRQISFPADLDGVLSSLQRTAENIADAESKLTLPTDLIRYAQFWFIENTEIDKIAINNLSVGSYDKAISIWEKKENLSSVHNRILTFLIRGNYGKALELAFLFYGKYSFEFAQLILGKESNIVTSESLEHGFLDVLCDEIGASEVSLYIINKDWGEYVGSKIVKPLIDDIDRSITIAKETRGKGANIRLSAGTKLMTDTLTPLRNLKSELSVSDSRYQIIADKLGLTILQCGIDYYNDSNDDDAAFKAMKLQKYAQSVVVGKMAKDRCDENVRILEGIISKLPPLEVMANHRAIQASLAAFAIEPDLISCSIQLIKDCAPHIVNIKEKLGSTHQYYLKISTTIINNALGNIIAEVNEAQNSDFNTLKTTLISAWRAQLYMDKFDLDPEYKEGRYKECREALHGIISNCKGFDDSGLSFMYQYGCGWCNDLDVSDVDLRTEEEFYQSCRNLTSYRSFLKRFPSGKYASQAKSKIEQLSFQAAKTVAALEKFIQQYPHSQYVSQAKSNLVELRFRECKTVADYQKFIGDFPNSSFVPKAQNEMNKLIREENERKVRIARQDKALSACKTTNDVVTLYESEKTNKIDSEKCSLRAYELAKSEDDYRKVVSTYGVRSTGGQKAKTRINEIERIKKEKAEKRSKALKRMLWAIIPLLILLAIYLIWGIRGFAVGCTIVAVISGFAAFGSMQDRDGGCGTFFICAAIAAVFGFSAAGLHEWADKIEKESESKELYDQIISNPSEESCKKYIQRFYNTDNADKVRNIWLSLLLNEAGDFDYDSYEGSSLYSSSSSIDNPIKKLQDFISKNDGNSYGYKAQTAIESICDSLYRVADSKATTSGWKQYQRVVPTDYFKDSESKIEEIENQAWNTESKAWQMALSENSISAFTKYKSLYPNGSHISQCEKKLIDLEVSRVYAGEHGSLPEMDRTGYGGGPTSYITVTNSTSYTLTLLYSGPDSKRLVISAGGTSSVRLKNGSYRVAASVSASNVSNYAGNENLQGGNYSVDYYISTYRY